MRRNSQQNGPAGISVVRQHQNPFQTSKLKPQFNWRVSSALATILTRIEAGSQVPPTILLAMISWLNGVSLFGGRQAAMI